jgi:ABC-type multidrug transport system fused ATPase/permease subunit
VSITADIISDILLGTLDNLAITLVFLFLFAIFQSLVFYSINFINETLAHRVTTNITEELFVSVQAKSLRYHDGKDVGQIMGRASGDTRTINMALSPGIVRSIQLFTIWGLALYIAFQVHLILVVFTLICFTIYIVSIYIYAKKRVSISKLVLENFSDLTEHSLQSVTGIREIKNFTAEAQTSLAFAEINQRHIDAITKEGEANAWFYPALIATFYSAMTITIAVYFTYVSIISFRELLLITGVIIFLRQFSSGLQWQARVIVASLAAIPRVYSLIHESDFQEYMDGTIDITDHLHT